MYQVSWAVNHGGNNIEDFFLLVDTYEEAEEHVEHIEGLENWHHWTVSMVLDASDPDHREVRSGEPDDRMEWRYNAISIAERGQFDAEDSLERGRQVIQAFTLLPPRLRDEELFATVMNLVLHYVDNPAKAARILSACSKAVHKVWDAGGDPVYRVDKKARRRFN